MLIYQLIAIAGDCSIVKCPHLESLTIDTNNPASSSCTLSCRASEASLIFRLLYHPTYKDIIIYIVLKDFYGLSILNPMFAYRARLVAKQSTCCSR